MAPYMSETAFENDTLSSKEAIKPSGIKVVIVGAGFAGLTAAIELSVFPLHRFLHERIADEISMNSPQRSQCHNLRIIQEYECATW